MNRGFVKALNRGKGVNTAVSPDGLRDAIFKSDCPAGAISPKRGCRQAAPGKGEGGNNDSSLWVSRKRILSVTN